MPILPPGLRRRVKPALGSQRLIRLRPAPWIEPELEMPAAISLYAIRIHIAPDVDMVFKPIKSFVEKRPEQTRRQRLPEGLVGIERLRLDSPRWSSRAEHDEDRCCRSEHRINLFPEPGPVKSSHRERVSFSASHRRRYRVECRDSPADQRGPYAASPKTSSESALFDRETALRYNSRRRKAHEYCEQGLQRAAPPAG